MVHFRSCFFHFVLASGGNLDLTLAPSSGYPLRASGLSDPEKLRYKSDSDFLFLRDGGGRLGGGGGDCWLREMDI